MAAMQILLAALCCVAMLESLAHGKVTDLELDTVNSLVLHLDDEILYGNKAIDPAIISKAKESIKKIKKKYSKITGLLEMAIYGSTSAPKTSPTPNAAETSSLSSETPRVETSVAASSVSGGSSDTESIGSSVSSGSSDTESIGSTVSGGSSESIGSTVSGGSSDTDPIGSTVSGGSSDTESIGSSVSGGSSDTESIGSTVSGGSSDTGEITTSGGSTDAAESSVSEASTLEAELRCGCRELQSIAAHETRAAAEAVVHAAMAQRRAEHELRRLAAVALETASAVPEEILHAVLLTDSITDRAKMAASEASQAAHRAHQMAKSALEAGHQADLTCLREVRGHVTVPGSNASSSGDLPSTYFMPMAPTVEDESRPPPVDYTAA